MKIVTKVGNLLDIKAGHLIQGVNAQGVMGAGIALAIKNKYPQVYTSYRNIYEHKANNIADNAGLVLGNVYPVEINKHLCVWNAVTQEFYGSDGSRYVSYDAIENCFRMIQSSIDGGWYDGVPNEIHIPLIGCGLAKGSWNIVSTIIEDVCTTPVTLWVLPQ